MGQTKRVLRSSKVISKVTLYRQIQCPLLFNYEDKAAGEKKETGVETMVEKADYNITSNVCFF